MVIDELGQWNHISNGDTRFDIELANDCSEELDLFDKGELLVLDQKMNEILGSWVGLVDLLLEMIVEFNKEGDMSTDQVVCSVAKNEQEKRIFDWALSEDHRVVYKDIPEINIIIFLAHVDEAVIFRIKFFELLSNSIDDFFEGVGGKSCDCLLVNKCFVLHNIGNLLDSNWFSAFNPFSQ